MNLLSQYKGLRRENYILCYGGLVTSMGSMIQPMLTLILSQKMGMSGGYVAWIMAVAGILMLPANLIGGKMADHFNKKMNIVYLDLISVVCYFICAATPLSMKSLILMFTASACQNMENSSYNALTADITVIKDRERAFSLQYLAGNLGFVLSPTIAGFLLQDYLWLAFLISGLAIGCSTLLIFFLINDITLVKDTSSRAVYQAERKGESLWSVLMENKLIVLYILAVSGYYAVYQMYNFLMPLDLARLHGESSSVIFGSITSVNCISVVIFTPLITRMFSKVPESVKTMFGQLLLLSGFVVFWLSPGRIPFYYVAIIVLTWGEIFNVLAERPYLTNRTPASHRGRINGLADVMRTGIAGGYQMMIGFIYQARASEGAWKTVLATGMFIVLLCITLIVRDRRVYGNLY